MKSVFIVSILLLFYFPTQLIFIMARQTSLFGKISGKLGAVVFATSGGQTISREYNPNVANPSTMAQVNQRARLKLMSQLSASLAPVIAIPKDGLVSGRNQFVKKNFSQTYANNGTAQVTYENLQLTNGNAGLPAIAATRSPQTGIAISLAENADAAVSRVVYIMYRKTSENTLQLVQSIIVEAAGAGGTFPGSMVYTEGDLVFYAYGMKDLSSNATAQYGNLNVANAVDVARLVATRSVSTSDFQYTETRGATMFADENEIAVVPEGSARVFVTANGNGSVTGAGIYEIGQSVTVVATPAEGYVFLGWSVNGNIEIISTNPTYTFEVEGQTDLVATFAAVSSDVTYNITARVSSSLNVGTVTIGEQTGASVSASVQAGNSITLIANTPSEYTFVGWFINDGGSAISNSETYTFTPNQNYSGSSTIVARFRAQGGL